jgi:hypothetical protein
MDGEALKGISALQHLQQLILIDNPLRTASYLNPLPPNLAALTITGRREDVSASNAEESLLAQLFTSQGRRVLVDVSAALSAQAQGDTTTDSTSAPVSGSNLLALHMAGVGFHEPFLLSSLTSLTALDASGINCQKPNDMLAVLPCLRRLRHLALSIHEPPRRYGCSHTTPAFGTEDFARLVAGCPDLESLAVAA